MAISLPSALTQLGVPQQPVAVSIGSEYREGEGEEFIARSPIDRSELAVLRSATPNDVAEALSAASNAFMAWRVAPAPLRGELVRRFGNRLREQKEALAAVVTWEAGKIVQESLGEVQEMIDICDFAVGLSRQLYGLTIASERPGHRLMEQWHPLGPVGVISAFNFPVAVWAWNAALAMVCGNPVIWKPSEKAPLCALACQALLQDVAAGMDEAPAAISSVIIGGKEVGDALAASPAAPLISATGSVSMGRQVAQRVAARLGRSLLELGGNNAMIVAPSADLELTLRSAVFSAAGTCGQRCTTLRRLIVHETVHDRLLNQLKSAYAKLSIGNPNDDAVLVGPLIDQQSFAAMQEALAAARSQGGTVHFGDRIEDSTPAGGYYVRPALVEISSDAEIVRKETFAPILYLMKYSTIEEAIAINNSAPQGLASAILTNEIREGELFCSPAGSDCGIANVNIGTSGAEIGGAFGGEKETGGGRESGTDAWKNYMRRTTNTINYSTDLPLAQGVKFDIH